MKLFVVGHPGHMGIAKSTFGDLLRMWREVGFEVGLIPLWNVDRRFRERCNRLGVETFMVRGPRELASIPFIHGSTVVSFGSPEFLRHASAFRVGCRIVWSNPTARFSAIARFSLKGKQASENACAAIP